LGGGGFKGEGIFELVNPLGIGTAPNINGGGAGTCKNGGGGGGSNAGSGGKGGNSSNECGTPSEISSGKGGVPVLYNAFASRAYMGGGGGGGNIDDPTPEGTNGAVGGGIIYLKTPALRSLDLPGTQLGAIIANGMSAAAGGKDGAGGGGAGGTILLAIDSGRNVWISASGGDGGNVYLGREDFCYAPGGGGGGGIIRFTAGSSYNLSSNVVMPGSSGLISGVFAACNNSSFGADSGRSGLVLRDLAIREAIFGLPPFSLGNDTLICESTPITLDAGANRISIVNMDLKTTDMTHVLIRKEIIDPVPVGAKAIGDIKSIF